METPSSIRADFLESHEEYRRLLRIWERDMSSLRKFADMCAALERKGRLRRRMESQGLKTDGL